MDRFVVGSGRCGSTLLLSMLAESPEVAGLFEVFNGLDMARRFAPEPISGGEYRALVFAPQPFLNAVLRRGYEVPEVVYPFERPGVRWRRGEAMPYLLTTALPRLSAEPDALCDAASVRVGAFPLRPAPEQHRALFAWLAARTGRDVWIEKSGSSIEYLGALAQAFPEARFLHLHRDGREVALSMREHHAYRLPISLLYAAPLDDGAPAAALGPLDLAGEPTGDDAISRILAARPPAEYFGRYWNDQIARGMEAARSLPADRYLEVAFEELVARPWDVLPRIAEFFALDPARAGWLARAAARVKGVPPARAGALGAGERVALEAACAPGLAALGRG